LDTYSHTHDTDTYGHTPPLLTLLTFLTLLTYPRDTHTTHYTTLPTCKQLGNLATSIFPIWNRPLIPKLRQTHRARKHPKGTPLNTLALFKPKGFFNFPKPFSLPIPIPKIKKTKQKNIHQHWQIFWAFPYTTFLDTPTYLGGTDNGHFWDNTVKLNGHFPGHFTHTTSLFHTLNFGWLLTLVTRTHYTTGPNQHTFTTTRTTHTHGHFLRSFFKSTNPVMPKFNTFFHCTTGTFQAQKKTPSKFPFMAPHHFGHPQGQVFPNFPQFGNPGKQIHFFTGQHSPPTIQNSLPKIIFLYLKLEKPNNILFIQEHLSFVWGKISPKNLKIFKPPLINFLVLPF